MAEERYNGNMTMTRNNTCSIDMPTETHTIQFSTEVMHLEECRNSASTNKEHACEPAVHFTVNSIELSITIDQRKKEMDRVR